MNSDMILKADNLHFSYDDDNSHSLNGLSLEIRRGQKVAFMGANGSGKSTFFLCCTGIHKPQSGKLYFNGEEVNYNKKGLLHLRSKVGIVFQDPDNQLFSASVYQEISFGILNLGISEDQAKKEVEEVIDYLEITPFRHKPTHALSGGQKQRLSIARVFLKNPPILIFDEATSALDNESEKIVQQSLENLAKDRTTFVIAHRLSTIRKAQRILVLTEDGIAEEGTHEELMKKEGIYSSLYQLSFA